MLCFQSRSWFRRPIFYPREKEVKLDSYGKRAVDRAQDDVAVIVAATTTTTTIIIIVVVVKW